MKIKIMYVVGLVFVFVVSVLVHLPASMALKFIPQPRELSLSGVGGTLWQGEVQSARWMNHDLGSLAWKLRPLAIFTGNISANVALGKRHESALRGTGEVGIGFTGIYVRNLSLSAPARVVAENMNLPVPVNAEGAFKVVIQNYRYRSPFCAQAQGEITWTNAQISMLAQSVPLEKVSARLACEDSQISLKGQQLSDMVQSEYSVTLTPKEDYQLQGWVKPSAHFPRLFSQWIQTHASTDAEGRYSFQSNGRLPN
ncbi:type II secretion system protein N [Vibrio mangrovi]|uniref:Type II secretion system protein N n=1 Tax=Vibrio mangrovi TaxID=474394 RepID=A0A1Y6J280_9VIBR|nr:type II secretion system protein N [Vibrio mangrovi]MDW6002643.1 type II secretion system protein N [Vibrio mangrovi]SMS02802.1 Type II secretion system protein N [Vibrio mangrovi]